VLVGLRRDPKAIPSKYLYDARGSQLFDQICELDEYYLTRTELGILRDNVDAISNRMGERCMLVEYGSGSSLKTRVLLDAQPDLAAYVPIDISREHLLASASKLRNSYPDLEVLPVHADFHADYELPEPSRPVGHKVVFFPGSSLGNLERGEAGAFLKHITRSCELHGGLLIGIDLHKDRDTLEAAYDDAEGVSAEFALNLLERMNRELGADFDLKRFGYDAFYDEIEQRIEMSIQTLEDQTVTLGGHSIELAEGEKIRTEYSHKFTIEGFRELAAAADLHVDEVWTDRDDLFSVQYLTCE